MSALCQLWAAAPAASVKGRLGLEQFDSADDGLLTMLIGWVSERVERVCGRQFGYSAGAMDEFDGDATELVVSRPPVYANEVIIFDLKSTEVGGWEGQYPDYLIRAASNGINCVVSLPSGEVGTRLQRLRITYVGGYILPGGTVSTGQTALPGDLEGAVIEQVCHWYQRRNQLGLSGASGQGGSVQAIGQSVVAPLDLLPSVMNTLRLYSRMGSL